ncbi:hypothetical protein [Paenochrobactrum sp. BZR 201-1]
MKFLVKGLGSSDTSQDIVRIHYYNRKGIPRHSVIELEFNGRKKNVVVLGHDENPSEILMDIDLREYFGIERDTHCEFEFARAGFLGKIKYLINATSPATFIPAWISVLSLFLGVVGAFLGAISLWK